MSLYQNQRWREIDAAMRDGGGLPGITSKIEIGQHDIYLKTAWFKGQIVRIDITLSRGRDATDDLPRSAKEVSLETTRYDLARAWAEDSCRMASNLLQTGEASIEDVISEWIGVEGYPQGYCPQLPGVNPETGEEGPTFQKGPLHVAALILTKRLPVWTKWIEALTNDV
jgi:hypothetical protein